MRDYSELRGEIRKHYKSEAEFGKEVLGLTKQQTSKLLNGQCSFDSNKIEIICEALKINPKEIGKYFFSKKVAKS